MDIPSKVAHTKYAVAETRISSVKLITVITVITMFFVLSSRYRAHVNQTSEMDATEPLHPT